MDTPVVTHAELDPELLQLMNDDDDAALGYEAAKVALFQAADHRAITQRRLHKALESRGSRRAR